MENRFYRLLGLVSLLSACISPRSAVLLQPRFPMSELPEVSCPYCGELVEILIDEGGGEQQEYIEDCPVCCQPWQVEVSQDLAGVWSVRLRTADE